MGQCGRKTQYLMYAALSCLLCGLLLAGVARGHFASQTERTVTIPAEELQPLYLQPVNSEGADVEATDWNTAGDGVYTMSFSLRNYRGAVCAETDMTASLLVLASLGIAEPENLTIRLTVGGSTYVGTPTSIPGGTAQAYSFGDGWCYRFYDAENREVSWDFTAGRSAAYRLDVTVSTNGAVPLTSMLRVQTNVRES